MESNSSRLVQAKAEKRKLIKFSNYSLCVTLPKRVITKLEWAKGDVVDLAVDEKKGEIVIKKSGMESIKEKKPAKRTLKKTDKKSSSSRW